MAKMPPEITNLFTDAEAAKVMATVDASGMPNMGVKGRLNAVDDETIAFAEMAQVKSRGSLTPGQKVAIAVFKLPNHGYQLHCTFQEYETSGSLFDEWAKTLKERLNADLKHVGMIKVEAIYSSASEDRSKHGIKIA